MNLIKFAIIGVAATATALASCTSGKQADETVSGLNPARFDSIVNNKKVALYTLKNSNGMEVCITNFGGRVVSLVVPDVNGKPTDVVLGYDNIKQYTDSVNSPSDFGSSVGRYANRIGGGKLTVAGKTYQLPQNNFGHCLHGGPSGWIYQVYDAEQPNDSTLVLTIVSPDGDNNFPGTVIAHTTYKVLSNNTLDITFDATTDKETVVNMTNHSYFNLNGDPSKEGTNMWLYLNADNYTPADSTYMTTGEIRSVEGTPMDFRKAHALEETINDTSFDQIRNATGYDHNWCLNTYKNGKGDDTKVCAVLWSPVTKIGLSMYTNEPGVQVYTGNFQGTGVSCKHDPNSG
ncbi:aldose epimerase family protein [uncultured Prevotella sp.]|uniref:aldose epimerase family protein n=1 Tax=uncultured Prevotella sp. TaxID=159272 RepID=UPI0027E2B71A|nr:aldose epimerase family protein [uncultured Prevotella sp.]